MNKLNILNNVPYTIILVLLGFVCGCAMVNQVDRGAFSKKIMQFEPCPELSAFTDEVHSIREGAAGGSGQSAGGGCGCN